MNNTTDKIVHQLNLAWTAIEDGIIDAYDDGYSGLVWQLKQIQLEIESLQTNIEEKEYGDE